VPPDEIDDVTTVSHENPKPQSAFVEHSSAYARAATKNAGAATKTATHAGRSARRVFEGSGIGITPSKSKRCATAPHRQNLANSIISRRARLCHGVYAARRMSRSLLRVSSALPLLALLACKLGKDNEQTDRPLPAPEPASTTPPARPVENAPPRQERPKEPPPRDPAPSEPTPSNPTKPKPATPAATATATTTATADAAAPAPTAATADAAAPAPDKMTQCLTKCQGSLSACLSKPVPFDAGVPSLESMAECKKAFEDCRVACTP
jgi:hypothetical protein